VPHDHRFRFGVQLSHASDGASWAALVRKVEDLGFDCVYVPDHFGDQFGPISALTAAADATEHLRVGTLVFDNDYRHPVVLAKEIATLDVLSGGRVEFGLGAGWMTTDYQQSGLAHDPAGVRIDRMEEAITVYKGVFSGEAFDFAGEHYTISGLRGAPRPVQTPHPPMLIGGGGKRVLSIAAREADIVGINPNLKAGAIGVEVAADATAKATDRKVGWVRDAAGDRFDDIELSALVFACIVTDDRQGLAENMAPMFGITADDVLEMPHTWIGSTDEIVDSLRAHRERWGFSHFVVQGDALEPIAPIVAALAGT
jgi:probable F420-dependent oxidoreductase